MTKRTAQLIVVFAILLILFGSGHNIISPKLQDEYIRPDLSQGQFRIAVTNSLWKVTKTGPPSGVHFSGRVEMDAAQDETESFQLVVIPSGMTSNMWLIRISICLLLNIYVVFSYLRVRNPKKYERYCGNKIITRQIIIVVVYNLLCYVMVLLPPSGIELLPYHLLQNQTTLIGFVVLGILLITCGIALSVAGVIKRKAIGGQYAPEGLVTSGVYSYFRHPIYSGIVWVCLGLALVARNLDGLLMCPVVLGVNMSAALMEERYEVGARFRDQYEAYKQTTAMFGPKWIWCVIILVLLTLVVNGYVSS